MFTSDQHSPKPSVDALVNPDVSQDVQHSIDVRDDSTPSLASEQIPQLFQNPKPSPSSKWIWLTVLVSLGLHVGLMLIPTGSEPKPEPPKEQEKQVRVTQLPTLNKTAVAKASPKASVPPKIERSTPVRSTTPVVQPPSDRPQAAPQTPKTAEPTTPENNSWADFPTYPTAQPGCFGLQACMQTSDAVSKVSAFFSKELTAKKYENKRTIQEANREVYQVSRNGQTQFLTVLQSEKGAVYVLAEAPRSLEELKKAVAVPPEVAEILSNLDAQAADASLFAQPALFFDGQTQKANIRNISLVASSAETMMDEYFRSNLQNNGFEVTDLPQKYGGGGLYQVKKGSNTLYLNLVPTKDGSGTLVVTWKTPPV